MENTFGSLIIIFLCILCAYALIIAFKKLVEYIIYSAGMILVIIFIIGFVAPALLESFPEAITNIGNSIVGVL